MSQQTKPAMVISAVVVLVVIVGFFAWRAFAPSSAAMDESTVRAHEAKKQLGARLPMH
ncbi:MAG TPA: hypothetical protein VGS41_04030 [Chthonomonadales bacterium]|nr:hypothetical protein [Chthonomonadales bacterium]